jgi:hypothetical protein
MSVQKAFLESELGDKFTCLFNPSQLSVGKSNTWQEGPNKGKSAPELVFGGGGAGTMSMELTFDTTTDGKPVTDYTDKLLELMRVDPKLPSFDESSNSGRPPWVKFHWGKIHSFQAIVESLNITFTFFSSDGIPLRAKANLSLKQFVDEKKRSRQNPTSGTPDPHRVHRFGPGETLDRIAAQHYGDAAQWRLIARANGIIDPLDITPGTSLVIPKREAFDAE